MARAAASGSVDTVAHSITGDFTSFSDFTGGNPVPLAITLASLNAAAQGDAIQVAWETVSELGNAGFNLYRDTSPAGPGMKLNAGLIPSQGPNSPSGFSYSYLDNANLAPGTTYTYWLEDVSLGGVATRHEPVSATYVGPDRGGAGGLRRRLDGSAGGPAAGGRGPGRARRPGPGPAAEIASPEVVARRAFSATNCTNFTKR